MLSRHVLLPLLVVGIIGVPALVFETNLFRRDVRTVDQFGNPLAQMPQQSGIPTGFPTNSVPVNLSPQQLVTPSNPGSYQNGPVAMRPQVPVQMASSRTNAGGNGTGGIPVAARAAQIDRNGTRFIVPGGTLQGNNQHPSQLLQSRIPFSSVQQPGIVQTVILPGDATGPNLNATPMEFLPTSKLGDIFRFDVYPDWVKGRWDRVSTAATDYGLHGLRVALVTGVNPNDLHGSLTYYFDDEQQVQRISFRGWTGDATRLVELMTRDFGLKPQQTHMTGLYLVKHRRNITGALLMQAPAIVRAQAPTQKVALSLEINRPHGPFILSHEIASLLPRANAQ